MLNELEKLRGWIEGGITADSFSGGSVMSLLETRDVDPFDSCWLEAARAAGVEGEGSSKDPAVQELIEEIKKAAYLKTFDLTGEADLAAEVSEDVGLIAAALVSDSRLEWVNALWMTYRSGGFPGGSLNPFPGRLRELV
jgi:hypothetical protein